MTKKQMLKLLAAGMSVAVLTNTCLSGMFSTSAESTPEVQTQSQEAVSELDNSNLIPAYLTSDKVTLEASDGGEVNWTPDWVKSLMLTELNVTRASTNGKFSGMEQALGLLAQEGVNGIWLTPINNDELAGQDGTITATPGNRYSNFGPDTISYSLTGSTDYEQGWAAAKAFVDMAHSYNIRVFLDVVTWGVNEQAPIYTDGQHANWFTTYQSKWNGYLFDWANAQSTGLYDWFKTGMVDMIKKTGADGFRADCGSSYAGTGLFRDVRQSLLNDGYKIAMFSEHPETRDGTFEFEEHSYIGGDYTMFDSHTFYTANNIVDAVKGGTFTGSGRFYNAMVSCHDYADYTSANDLITMGYASILTPYIPMWYFGEEWNNAETEGTAQLYQNLINYGQIDANRDYFETIKSYIRIRRTYADIFESYTADSTQNNIAKITTDATGLYQAYARYSTDRAVLIIPNNGETDAALNVSVPDLSLDSARKYRLINALTGEIIINGCSIGALSTFKAQVSAGKIGVYAIEKVASATSASFSEVAQSSNNDKNPAYRIDIKFNDNIGVTRVSGSSYWYENMQQYMGAGQTLKDYSYTLHNALADAVRENILINGVSVADGIAATGQVSTHVKVTETGSNFITIDIRKSDNPYGFDADTPFEIEIKDGITVNGYALSPCHIYCSSVGSSNVCAVYHDTAKFTKAAYTDGQIVLTADRNLESPADAVATAIGSAIEINGTPIDVSAVTASGNQLKIAYAATEDFNIYIMGGVILNGYELSPTRYNVAVSYSAGGYAKTDGDLVTVADDANGITPCYSYIQWKTLTEAGCTDTSHGSGYNYVINVVMNGASNAKSIQYTTNNFNLTHLAYYRADEINPYILINGKSIADYITENNGSVWKSIHIRAGSPTTLQIIIPETNIFGFDVSKPFTVTFAEGMKLNGYTVNARTFTCPGHDYANPKEYNGAYFTKVNKWSEDMISANNASPVAYNLQSAPYKNVCSSHTPLEVPPDQWVVDIMVDKDIIDTSYASDGGYYRAHLQQNSGGSALTSAASEFQTKILLNGKTLAQCHQDEVDAGGMTDWAQFMHLIAINMNGHDYLRLSIPKNNKYGFNGDADFTIQVKSGLMLNGITLNPYVLNRTAPVPATGTFTTPVITVNETTKVEQEGSYYVLKLKDTVNTPNLAIGGYSTVNGLMQDINRTNSDVMREAAADLCKYIRINGETIGNGNVRAGHFASAMCCTGDSYIFKLQLDQNNVYGISPTERCTVEIANGLMIDGYQIAPVVYTYNGSSVSGKSSGYWPMVTTYTNGTVSPRNPDNGAWITSTQNVLAAGDTVRVKVEPAAGYQLKAGSLTYTYWYQGQKVVKQLSEYYKSDSSADYYDFASPDVVGVIDAQFVPVAESANLATLGAQGRTSGAQGLRFVNRLYLDNVNLTDNTITIGDTAYEIKDYAVELAVAQDGNVDWNSAHKTKSNILRANDKFIDFTSEIVNIGTDNYNIGFAARAYLTYIDGNGDLQTVYSEAAIRSVNDVIS